MKILLINHFPLEGSGSGVYTGTLARYLRKKGHEVRIIIPENRLLQAGDSGVHPVYFDGITPEALPYNFPCFTTHPRSFRTFYDLTEGEYGSYREAFAEAIAKEVRSFGPDIIHAGHLWTLSALAGAHHIPLVVTVHGTDLKNLHRDKRYANDSAAAYGAASEVIAISEDVMHQLREVFGDTKGTLLHNSYDPEIFYRCREDRSRVLAELGIPGEYRKVVAFAGKFAEFKGIDTLIRAASLYEDRETATVLAGDGRLRPEMEQLSRSIGVRNIFFIGNRPQEEVRRLCNIADAAVIPSRREPFGMVVIEAMACGCPVIGSDSGSIPALITPATGRIFRQDDYRDLAETVRSVLRGNHFDRTLIAAHAGKYYSADNYADRILEIYRKFI